MNTKNWQLSLHEDKIVDQNLDVVASLHQDGIGRLLVSSPILLDLIKETKRVLAAEEPDFLLKGRLLDRIASVEAYINQHGAAQATRLVGVQIAQIEGEASVDDA